MNTREYIIERDKLDNKIKSLNEAKKVLELQKSELWGALEQPKKVREAIPEDIKVGNIIWTEGDSKMYWQAIEFVYNAEDRWKGYVANCGCRYGLDGAFVEVEE